MKVLHLDLFKTFFDEEEEKLIDLVLSEIDVKEATAN